MAERKAWACPSCGKTHAPHVDTCPEPAIAIGTPLPGSPYVVPRGARPEYDPTLWPYTTCLASGGVVNINPDPGQWQIWN